MTALPQGWVEVPLGEIALSVKNGIFVSRPGSDPDGVPILRISAVRELALDFTDLRYSGLLEDELVARDALITEGDLLFTRYNGNPHFVGVAAAVGRLPGPLTYPDKLIRVRPDRRVVDSRYLEFVCASIRVRRQVDSMLKTTAGQVGIAGSSIKELWIPLAPEAEQCRIVAALREIQETRASAENALRGSQRNLERLRASVLENLCRQSGRRSSDKKPDEWRMIRIGDIGRVVTGNTPSPKMPGLYDGDTPFITPADVGNGAPVVAYARSLTAFGAQKTRLLPPGAVLTVCIGATIGKVGWTDRACSTNQQINAIILNKEIADPQFLAFALASPSGNRKIREAASNTTLPILNKSRFQRIEMQLPSVEEQRKIVIQVREWESALSRLRRSVDEGAALSRRLFTATLAEAFAGRLVPQDPCDEPAFVLLERIRAERVAAGIVPRGGRRSAATAAVSAADERQGVLL